MDILLNKLNFEELSDHNLMFFHAANFALITLIFLTTILLSCNPSSEHDQAITAYNLGQEQEMAGNWPGAFESYSVAINIDPEMSAAYSRRAYVYFLYKQFNLALRDVSIAIELDSELSSAYYHRGLIFNSQENFEEARLNFTKALQLDPLLPLAYYNRAKLHYNSGNLESAVADLSEAIKISPNSGDFYMLRGQIYLIQDHQAKAKIDLEKVIAISGKEEIIVAAKHMLSMVK